MQDSIGPLLEALGEMATAGMPNADSPKWLRWGCTIMAMALLLSIVALLLWVW